MHNSQKCCENRKTEIKRFDMRKQIIFVGVIFSLISCENNNAKLNNSIDKKHRDTSVNDSIVNISSYCQAPIKLKMQSNYVYNLQSLKGSDFLEIPDAIELSFIINEGVFQSYQEIIDKIKKRQSIMYSNDFPCDSIGNYMQNFDIPHVNFNELTLIIFTRVWSDSYTYEVIPDLEKKQITILTTRFINYPVTITDVFNKPSWLLLPKLNDEIEVKFEQKDIKINTSASASL